jgi:hypothetical protein
MIRVFPHSVKWSFAILAALLLLLRPLCDVWAAGSAYAETRSSVQLAACEDFHGTSPHDSAPCCANLEDSVLASTGNIDAVSAASPGNAAIVPMAWIPASRAGTGMSIVRRPPGASPPQHSYYARSARIQR